MSIAKHAKPPYAVDMFGIIFLFFIGAVFYTFIGYGADEAVKIMLVLMWALLALSIPLSLFFH